MMNENYPDRLPDKISNGKIILSEINEILVYGEKPLKNIGFFSEF